MSALNNRLSRDDENGDNRDSQDAKERRKESRVGYSPIKYSHYQFSKRTPKKISLECLIGIFTLWCHADKLLFVIVRTHYAPREGPRLSRGASVLALQFLLFLA